MLAKASLVKPALPAPPRVVADASRCDLRAAPDASAADLRVLPHVVACLQSAPQHPMAAQRPTLRHRQLLVRARRELSASTSLPLQSQTFATPSSVAGQEHRNIHEHRSSIGRSRDIRSGTQGSDQLGIGLGFRGHGGGPISVQGADLQAQTLGPPHMGKVRRALWRTGREGNPFTS